MFQLRKQDNFYVYCIETNISKLNKMKTTENKIQKYLQKIRFKTTLVLSQEDIDTSFERIKERIDVPVQIKSMPVNKFNLFTSLPFKVACSVSLLLTMSFFGYRYYDSLQIITIANTTEIVKEIVLPDGSKVSLRPASTIAYHKNYSKIRNVELQGEALFQVTKDKQHPFTVETKNSKVTVLGTIFSVRAFPNETYTKALLKEGSVKFADNNEKVSVVLKPGEEVKLNDGSTKLNVIKVKNIDNALAWQSHNFKFENETLEDIILVISDAFNKKIEIRDKQLANQRFTLKLNRNESLPTILNILSDVAKFKNIQQNETIIIEKQ